MNFLPGSKKLASSSTEILDVLLKASSIIILLHFHYNICKALLFKLFTNIFYKFEGSKSRILAFNHKKHFTFSQISYKLSF